MDRRLGRGMSRFEDDRPRHQAGGCCYSVDLDHILAVDNVAGVSLLLWIATLKHDRLGLTRSV